MLSGRDLVTLHWPEQAEEDPGADARGVDGLDEAHRDLICRHAIHDEGVVGHLLPTAGRRQGDGSTSGGTTSATAPTGVARMLFHLFDPWLRPTDHERHTDHELSYHRPESGAASVLSAESGYT